MTHGVTQTLFLRQFVQSPRTVGAVLPSSPALARAMLAPIDFASARTIVEFGPGTGAFTREIVPFEVVTRKIARSRGGWYPAAVISASS